MDTLRLEIVTPDGPAYTGDVQMVTLSGVEGQMGILAGHVPLMTQVVAGELVIAKDGRDSAMAIGDGFVEITAQRVSILTAMAVAVEEIDEARVEEARQRAAARLNEKLSDEEVASVNASLARSLAQLHVKRRHRA